MLGKIEGRRRRGRQRMRRLDGITDLEQSPEDSEGKPGVLQFMGSQRLRCNLVTQQEQQQQKLVQSHTVSEAGAEVQTEAGGSRTKALWATAKAQASVPTQCCSLIHRGGDTCRPETGGSLIPSHAHTHTHTQYGFSYTDISMISSIYKLGTVREYTNCQHDHLCTLR